MTDITDQRLAPVLATVDFATEKLKRPRRSGRIKLKDLIPTDYHDHLLLRKHIGEVLFFFGFVQFTPRRIRRVDAATLTRRKHAFSLVFWRLTSAFYPEGRKVHLSKKFLLRLLEDFGFRDAAGAREYTALLKCLKVLGFSEGRSNRAGGVELLPPARLPELPRAATSETTLNLVPEWNVRDEYDIYASTNSVLIQFIKTRILDKEHEDMTRWRVILDGRGRKPMISTADEPDRGKWQNPDVLAYRAHKSGAALEVFAFEVKLNFDKEAIGEAMAFQSFSNFTYVAVAVDARTLLKHRRFLRQLSGAGIGVIGLGQSGNLRSWTELAPAAYRPCRYVDQKEIVAGYHRHRRIRKVKRAAR